MINLTCMLTILMCGGVIVIVYLENGLFVCKINKEYLQCVFFLLL